MLFNTCSLIQGKVTLLLLDINIVLIVFLYTGKPSNWNRLRSQLVSQLKVAVIKQ